jgi:hypothetical protein
MNIWLVTACADLAIDSKLKIYVLSHLLGGLAPLFGLIGQAVKTVKPKLAKTLRGVFAGCLGP